MQVPAMDVLSEKKEEEERKFFEAKDRNSEKITAHVYMCGQTAEIKQTLQLLPKLMSSVRVKLKPSNVYIGRDFRYVEPVRFIPSKEKLSTTKTLASIQ